MTKLEKVIAGLQRCCVDNCTQGSKCPYYSEKDCVTTLLHDALELLKEREPAKGEMTIRYGLTFWICNACDTIITEHDKFCRACGRAVKWDD